MAKLGRPSKFTPEIAQAILDRIARGEGLVKICKDEGMPALSSVWKWQDDFADFSDKFARARETQADTLADEIVALSDDESIPSDSRRIRVDARKWVAAKLKPRIWGDRQTVEHTGAVTIIATQADEAL